MAEEIKKLNPKDWHKLGSWPFYIMGTMWWFTKGFPTTWEKILGYIPNGFYYFDGERSHEYFDTTTINKLGKIISADEEKFFNDLEIAFDNNYSDFLKKQEIFHKLGNSEKLDYLISIIMPLHFVNDVYDWTVFIYEQLYHDEIYEEFRKIRGNRATSEFPKLITSFINTETLSEQIMILKEAKQINFFKFFSKTNNKNVF